MFCGSGGVGQDVDRRRGRRSRPRPRLGGKVLVLTIDPAQAPGRRARARRRSATSSSACPPTRSAAAGLEPRGELWAAMLDTKRVVGRPRAAARARRGDRVPHPRQPAVRTTSPAASCRATTTSRWSGSTSCTPTRQVRPHHHRHAADAERDRLPRGAAAHGRVLRRPAAALAHDAVPGRRRARRAACSTSRAGPSTRWPTGSSAASSSRTSPSSSSTSSRCTTGFVERAEAVERLLHDRRTTFVGRHDARGRAAARGRVLLRRAHRPRVPPRRAGAQQGAARVPPRRRQATRLPSVLVRRRATRSPRRSPPSATPRSPTRRAPLACCARSPSRSRNFAVVARREAELRAELAATARGRRHACPASTADIDDVAGLARIGERSLRALSAAGTDRGRVGPRSLELAPARTTAPAAATTLAHARSGSWRRGRPLADLCFSDLLLLAPVGGRGRPAGSWCSPRCGPTTGQTLYPMDLVGTVVDEVERPLVARVPGDAARSSRATPLLGRRRRSGCACSASRCGARATSSRCVTRETATTFGASPGELERHYLEVFDRFARDDRRGHVPVRHGRDRARGRPTRRRRRGRARRRRCACASRARTRSARCTAWASTRTRRGSSSPTIGFDQIAVDARDPRPAPGHRGGRARRRRRSSLRAIPLLEGDRRRSACCVLIRDVTDLRRRDRMLLSKDATIREIHHRVKNNLQTIAALLRLQGRRLQSPEAQAAIEESERRIRSIAIVHETLSRDAGDVVRVRRDRAAAGARWSRRPSPAPTVTLRFDGRGRRRRAARRGRDAARGRAQRADAERGRPRVPVATARSARRGHGARAAGTRGRSSSWSRWSTTASGCRRASRSSSRAGSGCRSCRRSSPASWAARSSCAGVGRRRDARARLRGAAAPASAGRAVRPVSRRRAAWRASALRSLRRSSSVVPPQMPASWLVARANSRHSSFTAQAVQMRRAVSICSSAGPVLPMGKKTSGSESRQAERVRHALQRPSRASGSR